MGQAVDQVVVAFFARPRSYTAEDVVEISCHGAPVVLRHAVAAASNAGARLAEPGEFTLRAYLQWPHRPAAGRSRARPDRIHHALPGAHRRATGRRVRFRAASRRSRSSFWN
jgi:hypothetical protein